MDSGHESNPALRVRVLTRTRQDGSTYTVRWRHPAWYAEVYTLWRLGLNDAEIARSLERSVNQVFTARARQMKLPRNTDPGGGYSRWAR